MIRYSSQKQPNLEGFETFFERELDRENRWVKLSICIAWDELAESYYENLSTRMGRPAKDARMVIGAVIVKHKLCLSDEETIEQIRENPYLQYFVGMTEFQKEAAFAPSLFVDVRRRMGMEMFERFNQTIVEAVEKSKKKAKGNKSGDEKCGTGESEKDEEKVTHQGKLIVDATVAEQAIRYPTDLSLLNESREISEKLIDILYEETRVEKEAANVSAKGAKGLSGNRQKTSTRKQDNPPGNQTAVAVCRA